MSTLDPEEPGPMVVRMQRITESRVALPGRGTARIREVAGPPGAPVLVLLHGLAATGGLNWGPSLAPLGEHFRVIALDQRGHGRGVNVRGRFRLADCADDVAALADALQLEAIIPVGYSMGGPVAQLVWQRHPDRVEGLVLCATASRFSSQRQRRTAFALSPALSLALRLTPSGVWDRAASRMLRNAISDPRTLERIRAEVGESSPVAVMEAAAALARFSSARWIGSVDVPTAVVVTTQDRLVPAQRQLQLAELIADATVHRVVGDHRVCVARPDLFVPALIDACDSVRKRTWNPAYGRSLYFVRPDSHHSAPGIPPLGRES